MPETGINRHQLGDHRDGPVAALDAVFSHRHILGQLSVWTHEHHLTFIFFSAVSPFSFQAGCVFPGRQAETLTHPHPLGFGTVLRETQGQGEEGQASR